MSAMWLMPKDTDLVDKAFADRQVKVESRVDFDGKGVINDRYFFSVYEDKVTVIENKQLCKEFIFAKNNGKAQNFNYIAVMDAIEDINHFDDLQGYFKEHQYKAFLRDKHIWETKGGKYPKLDESISAYREEANIKERIKRFAPLTLQERNIQLVVPSAKEIRWFVYMNRMVLLGKGKEIVPLNKWEGQEPYKY